ncbi:MAG TPA: hypothetical protein DEG47_27720, partial [Cyanobacteria bacterium UBA11148]|nr:hypothetical protein [Cyanobacteria bacterium UBA11148]
SGDISTNFIASFSGYEHYSGSGNGGAITLTASGDISTNSIYSFSYSRERNAGNGGEISLIARGGNIIGKSPDTLVHSFALSEAGAGTAGSGGNVTLEAQKDIKNLEILTLSSSNEAGKVFINGFGDLSLTNTRILTSKRVEVNDPFAP